MKELNHKCIVCGKEYHHCDSCSEMKTIFPWRIICDTSQHYQVFMIIKGYQEGLYSKDESKTFLDNIGINLNNIKCFKKDVQETIKEIIFEDENIAQSSILKKQ